MTRAELHALVWSEPMSRLAARLGMSDVALRRLCQRHDIPRPAPGHWTKLAYGRSIEPVPLPLDRFGAGDAVRLPAGSALV